MASPLTSSQFVRLLDERLTLVEENKWMELSSMIPTLYNVQSTNSAWEEYYSVGAVPDIPEFNGKISYLSIAPGYHTKIEPKEYSGGLQFERKLIDDKKYSVLDSRVEGLVTAAHRTQEKLGVRPFAYSTSTAFDFMTSEEGVALVSDSHSTKSGTSTASGFDNAGTTALSKTALAAARLAMKQFRNDISERIEISENLAIICPENLVDTAREIVGTPAGYEPTTTSANQINVAYNRYKIIPYPRLDDYDTNNWFLVDLDAMKKDLLWLNRITPETQHTVDFDTYIMKAAIYFRVAFGWKDWRWIYGSIVA